MPNDVSTGGIENKMGIHGSATCALNFGEKDDCIGYLLGEENKGMNIMFNMMNEARLTVDPGPGPRQRRLYARSEIRQGTDSGPGKA